MKYIRQGEWLLLQIDQEYHLKTIGEFLYDFVISDEKQAEYLNTNKILLNRKKVQLSTLMKAKDTLQIKAFENVDVDVEPTEVKVEAPRKPYELPPVLEEGEEKEVKVGPLRVVYEDDFLLVVDKPSGILIHSDGHAGKITLDAMVARYYIDHDIHTTVRHLHRLDMETIGLVLYSKCEFLQPRLDKMMRRKEIQRYYYAFVEGTFDEGVETGTINQPIARDRHDAKKYRVDEKTGKYAVTHYRIVRRKKRFTLLEVKLDTGRTHQIRVHMAYIGHPIVNDELYGEPYDNLKMGLQSYRVEMENPITHKKLHICIPGAF